MALALAIVVALASLPSLALEGGLGGEFAPALAELSDTPLRSEVPPAGGDACPPSCLCPTCPGNCGIAPGSSALTSQTVLICTEGLWIRPPLLALPTDPRRIFHPPRVS